MVLGNGAGKQKDLKLSYILNGHKNNNYPQFIQSHIIKFCLSWLFASISMKPIIP